VIFYIIKMCIISELIDEKLPEIGRCLSQLKFEDFAQ
jgi:hypothetical protein